MSALRAQWCGSAHRGVIWLPGSNSGRKIQISSPRVNLYMWTQFDDTIFLRSIPLTTSTESTEFCWIPGYVVNGIVWVVKSCRETVQIDLLCHRRVTRDSEIKCDHSWVSYRRPSRWPFMCADLSILWYK